MKNYGKRLRRLVIIVSSSTKGAHLYEFVELPLCPCCFKAIPSLLERTNSEGRTKADRRHRGNTHDLQCRDYKCDFFLELNDKHVHTHKNEGITN